MACANPGEPDWTYSAEDPGTVDDLTPAADGDFIAGDGIVDASEFNQIWAWYDNSHQAFNNRQYEGLFDNFHYDIGHGKGTGEGERDSEPVQDGYSGRPSKSGPVGDWRETPEQQSAPTTKHQ